MTIQNSALVIALAGLVAGCNECENGYKIKTEYKYATFSEYWHESPKDDLFDGAIRVTTSAYNSGRKLTLRCFRSTADAMSIVRLDVRYSISAPLLKRIVPELKKAGAIDLVLSVDGIAVGSVKVDPIAHDGGISFLGELSSELSDRVAAASKSIVAMPRQGTERLDEVVEFGVAELAKHFQPVKKACEAATPLAPSLPRPVNEKTKRS